MLAAARRLSWALSSDGRSNKLRQETSKQKLLLCLEIHRTDLFGRRDGGRWCGGLAACGRRLVLVGGSGLRKPLVPVRFGKNVVVLGCQMIHGVALWPLLWAWTSSAATLVGLVAPVATALGAGTPSTLRVTFTLSRAHSTQVVSIVILPLLWTTASPPPSSLWTWAIPPATHPPRALLACGSTIRAWAAPAATIRAWASAAAHGAARLTGAESSLLP